MVVRMTRLRTGPEDKMKGMQQMQQVNFEGRHTLQV